MTKYRTSFYTLSDCHTEKEIEAADLPALMAQLDRLMIDLSAPYYIHEIQETIKPMTTPTTQPAQTPAQAAEQFRSELRADLELLHVEIAEIRADLAQMRDGLTHASQPATAAVGNFSEMMLDNIIMTYDDKGKPTYKATGTPYNKFGVRVWPETLPALGIDPLSLKPGPNAQTPITARVLMQISEETGKSNPRKVTGKA